MTVEQARPHFLLEEDNPRVKSESSATHQGPRRHADEALFRQAVSCLQKAGLNFWVDYGTLLGLIREGGIIPWDGDFDFGFWEHEVTEEALIKAFNPKDFRAVSLVPCGKKAMHILPRDEKITGLIDITFYAKEGDRAIHRSHAAKDTLWTNLLVRAERFLDPDIHAKEKYKYLLEEAFQRGVPAFIKRPLVRGFEYLRLRNYLNGVKLTYDFPIRFFENLRRVPFLGVEINIPAEAEEYLAAAYGKDWRTPKQRHKWYEGATYIDGKRNKNLL